MHSIQKDKNGTWSVIRLETDSGTTWDVHLFKNLTMIKASRMANFLNGGEDVPQNFLDNIEKHQL